ncbi:MAG: thioredoxin fold domain-containing protein [Candidatus Eisenbacteria bacterium]|nr:thioredoxin fold domain-containing protein [Candidatus Eisenbacteria bacterium]
MGMIEIDDKNFEAQLLESEKLALLDFGGQWCQPCKKLEPILEELSNEYADQIVVGHCDVAKGPETAKRFGVMGVPTVVFLKGGQEIDRFVGLMPRDKIVAKIQGHL